MDKYGSLSRDWARQVSSFRSPGSGVGVNLGLVLVDVLALEASLLLAYLARQALGFLFPAKVPLEGLVPLALALLLFPLGYGLAGLYPGYGLPAVERMRRRVQVTFLLYLALIAWNWLFSQEDWSRSVLLMAMGFSLVLVPLGETLVMKLLARLGLWSAPVGFYGGHPEALEALVRNLSARFPGLRVVYAYSPPFRPLTPEEDERVTEEINASGARILFVGLGCPKQEWWMAEHKGRVRAVMLGVGAAFDFHAGRVRQAPVWMQRAGLEWLFRLVQELRRLWRRYLKHNPRFLLLAFLQLTGMRRFA
jgi:exopolysaccharide biosynthesis WecB/TagA/CpsF family protein